MTLAEALRELQTAGTAQNRKVYARHGVRGEMFGVSYANLRALAGKLRNQPELAQQLWATGNHDARVLATMVADTAGANLELLESWAADVDNYILADAVSAFIGCTAYARDRSDAWRDAEDEWTSTIGWTLVAHLAVGDKSKSDNDFEPLVGRIEDEVHSRPNRTRHAMNAALMAIGLRSPALKKKAIAAARKIGKVEVDHGQTGCKTPDAIAYIERGWQRRKK